MAQFGSIITNIGLAKISNAQITNSTIGIESMVLGDGNGAYYTVSQSQTALRNEVWRGLLADQRIDANNPNRIEFSAFIPSSVGGFTIREVGLLDTDGNLIALSLYPEQYKPTLGEGISDDILIHFVIETSNASVITLAVDVTNVIATRQYVDRKTAEVNDALAEHLEHKVGKVIKGSREASLPGVQTITLTDGLLPKKIVVNAWMNHTKKWSKGVWISGDSGGMYSDSEGNIADSGNYVIVMENAVNMGGPTSDALIKNVTKTSFDLDWTLIDGGVTGAINLLFDVYYHGEGDVV